MPSWACSQRSLSRLISWSRPVSGVSPAGSAASIGLRASPTPCTRKSSTGCATPLILRWPRLAQSNWPWINRWVAAVQTTWPGAATSSSRTATFRASPTSETASSPASTTAGPVWMPTHGFSSSVVFAAELLAEGLQVLEDAEAGPCGAACGVLVGHRVAEARQQPLLVALHDRPVEPAHGLLAGLLEGPQHLGLVLRVEVSRYASDSNRSQPQTRTVTCRRSASRARRRDEDGVEATALR